MVDARTRCRALRRLASQQWKLIISIRDLSERLRHRYVNLYLASRHCNNSKRRHWPTAAQIKDGIRFLDCCRSGITASISSKTPSLIASMELLRRGSIMSECAT